MTESRIDEEIAEHPRFARYLHALEQVVDTDEADLVAAVLRDQDATMADSAVGRHLDRRATQLLTGPAFVTWARTMAAPIGERDYLSRRLREWRLLRSIALGEAWTAEELIGATDWCQRTATNTPLISTPAAVRLLADHGRTRRIRNAARLRLRQLEQ
ncbi:hypothetical protein ABZ930_27445 [Streptomyces sp. NPDC046716]|uniref:hypothetical protein n=1 Tax=Streptomyces sp. NPDC046716 TaxID=3157093 RepID=UPI0033CEFF0D